MKKLLTILSLVLLASCGQPKAGKDGINGLGGNDGQDGIDLLKQSFYFNGEKWADLVTLPQTETLNGASVISETGYYTSLQYSANLDEFYFVGRAGDNENKSYLTYNIFELYEDDNCGGGETPIVIKNDQHRYAPEVVSINLTDLNLYVYMEDKENLFEDIDQNSINSIGTVVVDWSNGGELMKVCETTNSGLIIYFRELNKYPHLNAILIENNVEVSGFDHTVIIDAELVEIR